MNLLVAPVVESPAGESGRKIRRMWVKGLLLLLVLALLLGLVWYVIASIAVLL